MAGVSLFLLLYVKCIISLALASDNVGKRFVSVMSETMKKSSSVLPFHARALALARC